MRFQMAGTFCLESGMKCDSVYLSREALKEENLLTRR